MSKQSHRVVTFNNPQQVSARGKLRQLLKDTPLPDDQLIENLGLYTRSITLAKTLYINEIYQKIVPIPGIIIEFGVWWGANLVMLNNFRNVYEPYNRLRHVVGFDTFDGYDSFTDADGASPYIAKGDYGTADGYVDYLDQVLDTHESENVLSNLKKYDLIKGNVVETVEKYFADNPETIVALAYFDLSLYEPTKKCLEVIKPHLIPGSLISVNALGSGVFPGETIAFRETLGLDKYKVYRSQLWAGPSYIIID